MLYHKLLALILARTQLLVALLRNWLEEDPGQILTSSLMHTHVVGLVLKLELTIFCCLSGLFSAGDFYTRLISEGNSMCYYLIVIRMQKSNLYV